MQQSQPISGGRVGLQSNENTRESSTVQSSTQRASSQDVKRNREGVSSDNKETVEQPLEDYDDFINQWVENPDGGASDLQSTKEPWEEETDDMVEDAPLKRNALHQQIDPENRWTRAQLDDAINRIYILGTGSLGNFVAHSLRSASDPPPITLLLRRREDWAVWEKSKRSITIVTDGQEDRQTGFEVEVMRNLDDSKAAPKSPQDLPIVNLIITTKAQHSVAALSRVMHRLSPASTISFLQNGMGATDEVVRELFRDPAKRPSIVAGVVSHGVCPQRKHVIEHRGRGSIFMSIIDRYGGYDENGEPVLDERGRLVQPNTYWSSSARYILRLFTRNLVLNTIGVKPHDLFIAQLQKLAVNAVINPLTAVHECRNGELLMNRHMQSTMRLLLAEISLVLRNLPELKLYFPVDEELLPSKNAAGGEGSESVLDPRYVHHAYVHKLSPEQLEHAVMNVARQTQDNESSMFVDVKAGRDTEVQYINGFIVRRGEQMGVKCVMNYMMCNMVEAHKTLNWRRQRQLRYEESWNDLSDEVKQALGGRPM